MIYSDVEINYVKMLPTYIHIHCRQFMVCANLLKLRIIKIKNGNILFEVWMLYPDSVNES